MNSISKYIKSLKILILDTCILCLFLLFFTECKRYQKPLQLPASSTQLPASSFYKIVHKTIGSYIRLPGEFIPFEEVMLYPKVTGFVKNVYVDRGSIVKKGQVLLDMEAPEIDQQLIQAKSKLYEAEADLNTKKEKYDRLYQTSLTPGTVAPFDLQAAHNDLISAEDIVKMDEANVAASQTIQNYLNINAPFDGVITRRNVHPGAFTGPSSQFKDPVLVLKEYNKLRLTVQVPESFVDVIDENAEVPFTINALPTKVFTAKISRTSKSVNEINRAMSIEIDVIDQPDIKPGMYAEVKIPLVSTGLNSFVVPSSAVLTTTEKKFVAAVERLQTTDHSTQYKIHFIDVREGISDGHTTEVFGDIPENTTILTKPSNEIKDGSIIK